MLYKVTIFVESGTLVLEEVPSAQQHFLNMITTQEVCYRAVLHVRTVSHVKRILLAATPQVNRSLLPPRK